MDTDEPAESPTPPICMVALHIGAGAVSMLIAEPDGEGGLKTVDFLEQPAPVARDVFRFGRIGGETTERIVEIILGFGEALRELGLDPRHFDRAVATNIISEATNYEGFMTRIRIGCGVGVELLEDGEMTRLIYLKTRRRLRDMPAMRDRTTLVVHVGPGNTRALLFRKGAIVRYTSYRLGTHRAREAVEASHAEGEALLRVIRKHVSGNLNQLRYDYRDTEIEEMVAIGYELQLIGRFAISTPGEPLSTKALGKLAGKAARMTDHEMVRKFQIDYRTAESLLPALEINLAVAESLGLQRMLVPASDYERGLIHDLLISRGLGERGLAKEVRRSARILAKRYQSDPLHGKHVARVATLLFERLAGLHRLAPYDALLLEVAAILHEIGSFISPRAHHKHSEYIILNSEIFGLDRRDVTLIALVARYHRHSGPKLSHRAYRDLSIADRVRVSKLAAILRVADALDRPHDQRVENMEIEFEPGRLILRLPGVADAAIERLAMQSKGDLFAQVFGLRVIVEEGG
jgi:exopolyphosphatase/guanosine-5'-triphosphate,3'-diphosphate pyrophosphatase